MARESGREGERREGERKRGGTEALALYIIASVSEERWKSIPSIGV